MVAQRQPFRVSFPPNVPLTVTFTLEEAEQVGAKALDAGVSVAEFIRCTALAWRVPAYG